MTIMISKDIYPSGKAYSISGTESVSGNGRRSVFEKVIATMHFVNGRLARKRSRKVLVNLDDRMLKDIGISRAQAEAEAKSDFWK